MASAPPPVSNYPRPNLEGTGPACPRCASTQTKEVKYTWWGGLIGPKIFNLQKCDACGFQFNRKTGKSITKAVIIYNVVIFVVAFGIFFAVAMMK